MQIDFIHHVALTVTDLERSKRFYREILMLREMERPAFTFPGAWFQAGNGQVHLIVHTNPTFREGKKLDTRDVHFAMRVKSFSQALEHFRSKGYSENAADDFKQMSVSPHSTAGFAQIFILDPDRHVIEVNAETPD